MAASQLCSCALATWVWPAPCCRVRKVRREKSLEASHSGCFEQELSRGSMAHKTKQVYRGRQPSCREHSCALPCSQLQLQAKVPGSQPDSQVISSSQVERQVYPEPGVWENLSASETCSLDLKDNLQTLNKMSNDYGPIYYYLQGILNPSVKFFFFFFLKGE